MNCEIKRDVLMIRVGGGFDKFFEWVPRNHRFLERSLVVHMIKSGESLEWVIEQLFNGKKILNRIREQNLNNSTSPRRSNGKSVSPGRQSRRGFSFREVSPYSKGKTVST